MTRQKYEFQLGTTMNTLMNLLRLFNRASYFGLSNFLINETFNDSMES